MRIAHFITTLDLEHGGTVRAVLDLAGAIAARGHTVDVMTMSAPHGPDDWDGRAGRPRIHVLASSQRPLHPIGAASLARARSIVESAGVLHLHGIWQPECVQLACAARAAGVPYIVTIHGMLDDWSMAQKALKKRLYYRLYLRRMLRGAAAIHTTATAELEQSRKWFPPERGIVIPYLFDLEPFADRPGAGLARQTFPQIAGGRPMALFLSRLHEKKGVERLIDAARLLAVRGVDVTWAIAGSGDEAYVRTLEARIRTANLKDRVHLLGFVTGTLKISLYQAADLFVLPTSQENFGFVLTEAMACGTPVITTKGVDIWPELESSGGAIIAAAEPAALADAVAELLADGPRRAAMGELARTWVFQWLKPERIIERHLEVYQAACSNRKGPPASLIPG